MNTRRCFAFFAIIAVCSCKKSTDKNASCRIVTATEVNGSNGSVYNITYNNDGKISTLTSSGTSTINKVFTYSGNTMIINVTNAGSFYSRDSVTLDAKGRPTNIRQYWDVANTDFTNYAFEYNGDQLLKYIETTEMPGTKTTTITTTNGNVTKVDAGGTVITLEYFTDKGVQKGDYLELSGLVQYGVNVYPHKNLIKSINYGSSIGNFNYEMNDDGLIGKVNLTSGSSSGSITYQYQCN